MKTNNIIIRAMTLNDINDLTHIHRSCGVPWNNVREGTCWIEKRLERGFYIRAAEVDGKVVAHTEWVISDEPDRKYLYLGLLDVDEDYQRKGIGRLIIADGIEYAKENGCESLVTLPESDNTSIEFYKKCGFEEKRKIYETKIMTEKYKDYVFAKKDIEKVPFEAIKEKRFMFDRGQIASRHLWEVYNEKPSTDSERFTPAVMLDDGTFIQLSWNPACWTNSENFGHIIKSALAFAYSHGRDNLVFCYFDDEEHIFDGFDTLEKRYENVELVYYLK